MLDVVSVSKSFRSPDSGQRLEVLANVDLHVARGECVTIVGPSGCGKSTLLRCIAGLTPPDSGMIKVGSEVARGPGRDRAVVFQQPSLLPWRTAAGNVAYGMQMQRLLDRAEISSRVDWALQLVGLTGFANYYPGQLSGGMQQRVNLARALATQPDVLLMDEPFGALDALTKERLHQELLVIAETTQTTIIFITHDIEEALFLGDRVAVMRADPGRITDDIVVPFDRPRDVGVYREPTFQEMRYDVRRLLISDGTEASEKVEGPSLTTRRSARRNP